jgi:hypothetical protein
MDILPGHLEIMTIEAKLLLGNNQIVGQVAIMASLAVPGCIRAVLGIGGPGR